MKTIKKIPCPCNHGFIKVTKKNNTEEDERRRTGINAKLKCPTCEKMFDTEVRISCGDVYFRMTPKNYPRYSGYVSPANGYPDFDMTGEDKRRNALIEEFDKTTLEHYVDILQKSPKNCLGEMKLILSYFKYALHIEDKDKMIEYLQRCVLDYDDYEFGNYLQRNAGKGLEEHEREQYESRKDVASINILIYEFEPTFEDYL